MNIAWWMILAPGMASLSSCPHVDTDDLLLIGFFYFFNARRHVYMIPVVTLYSLLVM